MLSKKLERSRIALSTIKPWKGNGSSSNNIEDETFQSSDREFDIERKAARISGVESKVHSGIISHLDKNLAFWLEA